MLALSHAYASFDGFRAGSDEQHWFQAVVSTHSLTVGSSQEVETKSALLQSRLRRDTGRFTCLHLTDLDAAVLASRSPELTSATSEADLLDIDTAEPAAHSVNFGGRTGYRVPTSMCEGYDAEAQSPVGRQWVRGLYDQGLACLVDDEILSAKYALYHTSNPYHSSTP